MTITLTNRFPAVSAALRDDKGNAVVDGTTILFPDHPAMGSEDLRTIRSARVAPGTGLTYQLAEGEARHADLIVKSVNSHN